MSQFRATIGLGREVKLLVTDEMGDEVVRARLPFLPDHPRALLTLLEGLALWCGSPLTAAVSVARSARYSCDRELFGGAFGPADSALVRFFVVERHRPRRLRGMGDFRELLSLRSEVVR